MIKRFISRPIKIAHLTPNYFSGAGGLQVCVHNICKHHTQKGMDVSVLHRGRQPLEFKPIYTVNKFPHFRMVDTLYPLSKYLIAFYIKRFHKMYDFDLWQVNDGYPYGALLADYFRKNRIPSVLRCSGDDIQICEVPK